MSKTLAFLGILAITLGFTISVSANNTYGVLTETISIGHTISIGLNDSPSGSWALIGNSNERALSAVLTANTLVLQGLVQGNATVYACATGTFDCLQISVKVSKTGEANGAYVSSDVRNNFYPLKNLIK